MTSTDRQHLLSVYERVYRRLERRLAGGLAFGMDFATVRALAPVHAHVLRSILEATLPGPGRL